MASRYLSEFRSIGQYPVVSSFSASLNHLPRSQQLQSASKPVTPADIAQGFTRAKADDVAELLDALVTLGKARTTRGGRYVAA
jgi:hypothetical protein